MARSAAFISEIKIHKDGTKSIFGRLAHDVEYKIYRVPTALGKVNIYLKRNNNLELIVSGPDRDLCILSLKSTAFWQKYDAEDFLIIWEE